MNLDALNKWLTLLANFGVIGGLVLIAVQMNFNTETIRLQNAVELNRGIAAGELAFMGDSAHIAYATALFHPAELTEAQVGQVWAYINNTMMSAQNTWLAYNDGLASEESWGYAKRVAAGYAGFRVGRMWWESTKTNYDPDFVKAIDDELVGSDPASVERATRQILDDIKKLERDEAVQSPADSPLQAPPSAPKA